MYKTSEIAKYVHIHPNTVRLYEEWGYISPVPRASNGYRIYSDIHLFQLRVARISFRCEIVQGHIRAKARAVVEASGKEEFEQAFKLAQDYLARLEREYGRALEAIELVEKWLSGQNTTTTHTYSRRETALLLDVSSEIIRNWERNGLITVPRLSNGHRVYTLNELNRMKIIRTLRAAHYSTIAILRLLNGAEHSKHVDVKVLLDTPEDDDIIYVTDRLIHSLEDAIEAAHELIRLLSTHIKKHDLR